MIRGSLFLLAELVALFFGVAFLVQLGQRRLGQERLRTWMGGRPVVAALKGISVGFITPFCTYSALPLLVGLRRARVTPAGYVAFIVAAPVLDPVLFGALVVIVGFTAAAIYAAVAFTAALTLALIAERLDIERHLSPVDALTVPVGGGSDAALSSSSCATESEAPWAGARIEVRAAVRSAAALLRSMSALLLVGVSIGLAIEAFVPADSVADITGRFDLLAIPVAAALGTPLYFNTELFVPIADSLESAGVGIGAIVALTIAGAGANVPEFILLSRLASRRLISIFIGYVFSVAVIGGSLAQLAS
jgi:uncharacterized membrane protein YraQ (UPF0718 family)